MRSYFEHQKVRGGFREKSSVHNPGNLVQDQHRGLKKTTSPSGINYSGAASFDKISIFASASVQPKLKINALNDKYEQEADQVAEQVMGMPETTIARKCNTGINKDESLQTKSIGDASTTVSPALNHQIQHSRGGGQPMDPTTRSFMENRFGVDFSKVSIHTGTAAADMNRQINAKAFTVGKDIFFNNGEYQPGDKDGKMLLAHELTHVMQQGKGAHPTAIQKKGTEKKKAASKKKDQVKTKVEVVTEHDFSKGKTKTKATTTRSAKEKVAKGVTASASEKIAGDKTTHSAALKAKHKKSGLFAEAGVKKEQPHDPAMTEAPKTHLKVGGQWTLMDATAAAITGGGALKLSPDKTPSFSADGKVVFVPNGVLSPEITAGLLVDEEGVSGQFGAGLGWDITDELSVKAGANVTVGPGGNLRAAGGLGLVFRFP